MALRDTFAREVAARAYRVDAAQQRAIERLDALRERLLADPSPASLRHRLRSLWRPRGRLTAEAGVATGGLYLWGAVGRGKTWLMDLFYESLPQLPRQRAHFHHFMRDVHAGLRRWHSRPDPLQFVARELAGRARLICLDELFVSDIADAMILGGLFEALLASGSTLVITSNAAPEDLYRDGLQRARFLPAIALLQRRLEVLNLDGGVDYRLRQLQRRPIYLPSADAHTPARLQELFEQLAGEHGESDTLLHLQGRRVRAHRRRGAVVWFEFPALCEGARSQNDYLQLAEEFHTVLLAHVPVFSQPSQDNAARRFISLIDEFYDQGVKLVISAAAPPPELYRGERLRREFERTASRLMEMQSEAYLSRAHRR